jgi:hypothetical protein
MDDFFRNLRKKHEDSGISPKMNTRTIEIMVEGDWEEFIFEDKMHPEGATLRILSEHGVFLEHPTFFFQGLLTLLELNESHPEHSVETILYLKEEIKKTIPQLTKEETEEFKRIVNFEF